MPVWPLWGTELSQPPARYRSCSVESTRRALTHAAKPAAVYCESVYASCVLQLAQYMQVAQSYAHAQLAGSQAAAAHVSTNACREQCV